MFSLFVFPNTDAQNVPKLAIGKNSKVADQEWEVVLWIFFLCLIFIFESSSSFQGKHSFYKMFVSNLNFCFFIRILFENLDLCFPI